MSLRKKLARCLEPGDEICYFNATWRDIVDSVQHGVIPDTIMVRMNNDTATRVYHKQDMVYVS